MKGNFHFRFFGYNRQGCANELFMRGLYHYAALLNYTCSQLHAARALYTRAIHIYLVAQCFGSTLRLCHPVQPTAVHSRRNTTDQGRYFPQHYGLSARNLPPLGFSSDGGDIRCPASQQRKYGDGDPVVRKCRGRIR